MSMRLVLFGLLLSATAVLGIVIYHSSLTLASHSAPPPPPAPLMMTYMVAARPLPAGTLVRDSDLTTKTVRADQLPPHAIIETRDARGSLRGALVPRYLDAGAPVTLADVLRPRDRGFLATVLAPGTRAVSVPVDAVTGVSGLIWPGDLVDVLLTEQVEGGQATPDKRVLSRTILEDIRVIAVDQRIVQGATGDVKAAGHVARTVTLEVTPDQAERLAVGQRLGVLSLAIRPLQTEAKRGDDTPVFGGDLSPELQVPHHDAPTSVRMLIIEGDQRSVVRFQ